MSSYIPSSCLVELITVQEYAFQYSPISKQNSRKTLNAVKIGFMEGSEYIRSKKCASYIQKDRYTVS